MQLEGQPVANLKCLPRAQCCPSREESEEAKPEEELDKMRIDREAPEAGTTSTEFRGKGPEGTRLEDAHLCRRRLGSEDTQAGQLRGLRVEKLLQRVERAGMDSERLLVPGFESEVREEKEAKQKQEASDTKAGKQKESVYQMDFRKRIEERTRKMAMVKTHMSYKSIVREYGEEAEEGNLLELLERFQKMFQPKHTLRPSGGRRRFESSVKSIRVHISLAKVYDAPLRWQQEAVAQQSAPPPPLGGVPGLQTFGAPVSGPGRGFQWPRQMGSPFAGSSDGVFGATPAGIQTQQLPEIVIEMTLQDFHGNLLFKRTERAQQSTDPDINQILELPLHAAGIAGMEELTQENLIKYSGELTINVFDELSQRLPGSGQEVRVRTQLRHLGKFVLPWDTLYAAKCSVKGHFPVDQHVVLFGYRPKSEKQRLPPPVQAEGAPPPPPSSQAAKMMCLGLEVTVDPPLEHPTRVQPQITLGKEPNMMLKHVQKWHDLLKSRRDSRILALGTDVDGRSCLICRFIRPQKPPDILPENPFAIEMAARYVSMIPSLQDNEMWNVEDLWCTDQEFLDIQCGDWEEHCILLCNFFNYIDRYRRECVGGYSTSDIQSYCVICDLMPEGEAVVVLRMDRQSGNCEFWHALKGRCYFLPAAAAKQRWSLCPRGTAGTEDDAAQPDVQQASVLKAMTSIPIRKVHLVFNADNVWANLQSERAKSAHKGVAALSWDLDDARRWKPLFARGREDLRRLSGLPPDPTGEDELVRDFSKEWRLEDPSQALTFQPKDEPQAARLENIFQLQLEQDIIDHRAGLKGTIVKDSRSTKFNHVIADRLGQLLEGLETLANSARRSGYESSFPLKSHATPPVTLEAIEAQMHEIENDFRRMGRPGRSVFGLPFNEPYKDYSLIWDAIYQSRILELGGDQADYALKVRIFPYAAGVLSIWVFIAAAMDV
ncbi:Cc2d2a [Symbiodinium sp. CCMP2592]|nr:Cc2d2a [Symbiodinium sp. CCMP2592]